MALKGDRHELDTDITKTCESVAERGLVLVNVTPSGSGIALGDSAGKADLVVNPSGYSVAGILLNDVHDVDLTQYSRNYHKDETKKGTRCRLLLKGWCVTDEIVSGQTPAVGGTAYLGASGQITATLSATGGLVATPKVGRFESIKDELGFVKVSVNLPN